MPTIRGLAATDRDALAGVLRADETFRPDEVAVALELVDDALAGLRQGVPRGLALGSSDYWIQVAEVEARPSGRDAEPDAWPGGVAGYICYGPTPMTEATYDLYWIVCHPGARGRGVASALIRAMEADLRERGGGNVRVETSELEGYGAARALYDRMGYPEAARLPDFYRRGDGLIIYYKQL